MIKREVIRQGQLTKPFIYFDQCGYLQKVKLLKQNQAADNHIASIKEDQVTLSGVDFNGEIMCEITLVLLHGAWL